MELDALLVNSGHKYRKEILAMPVVALMNTVLKHMTLRQGVRGDETVGSADSDAELRPYQSKKGETDTSKIIARTLTTYLGDVVEEFDPYKLFTTVYGEHFADLTERKDAEIVKKLCLAVAARVSKKLAKAIWGAKRNEGGSKTTDLFNGFDTITAAEIEKTTIGTAKGNMIELGNLTEANIGDELEKMYDAASEELQESENLKLFLPRKFKRMYDKWCKAEFGDASYNKEYNQHFLHCADEHQVELVSLTGMADAKYIYFTTKENMLVGCDQRSAQEKVKIRECDNPKLIQFFMCMFFGVNFNMVTKEFLMVGKLNQSLPAAA